LTVSLSVHVTTTGHVVVVALTGAADADMLTPLRAPMAAALTDAGVLVLHLDQLSAIDADALRSVVADLPADVRGGQLRIAASDPLIRGQLSSARVHHLVPIHHSVAKAASPDPAGT
jgi:hypothetical protein